MPPKKDAVVSAEAVVLLLEVETEATDTGAGCAVDVPVAGTGVMLTELVKAVVPKRL
jgi:hypothetical protein